MQQPIDKELLRKYIHRQCSPAELEQVKAFLITPGYKEILDELIREESEEEWNDLLKQPVRADEQMREWHSKFEERRNKVISMSTTDYSPRTRFTYLRYAAIFLLFILGAGYYSLQKENNLKTVQQVASLKTFQTKDGERATITLSDQTIVYMGPGSTLKYPEKFSGTTREISLTGEAFFEVAHNPAKPFQIHSGQLKTTVLGTSFKVNAFEGQAFEVKVATGKVRVDRMNKQQVEHLAVLTPGQQVRLSTTNSNAELGKLPVEEVLDWKASRLVFRDNTLQEITRELQRAYDVHINFVNPVKAREVLTVTLQVNVPLKETLKLLSQGARFTYNIQGKSITIK